jgi:hypothetical protein
MRSIKFCSGVTLAPLFTSLLFVFAALGASADPLPVISKGTLTLKLGAIDQFVWGPTGETQEISGSNCSLITGTNLMSVTSTGTPGFNYDSIGIRGNASSGVPCSRVSVGEGALRLELGSSTSLTGLVVTRSSFDIEAKKNVVIKAVTYDLVAGAPSQTFYLVTGKSKTNSAYNTLPNADLSCSSASDSGPDSGASDNCRWNVNGQWTKIELTALVGEFGLEGGGDGTGPTTFDIGKVGDGFLACPSIETPQTPSEIPPPTPGPGEPTITGARLENVDDPLVAGTAPVCVPVPYDISTTCPTGVTGACTNFEYNPLNQGTNMGFTFHWDWPLEAIPPTGIDGVKPTLQFFINGNPVGVELDFCPELVPVYDGAGNVIGVDPNHLPGDQDLTVPGTQAGCLIRRDVKQVGDKIQIVEDAYVQGDYTARRN